MEAAIDLGSQDQAYYFMIIHPNVWGIWSRSIGGPPLTSPGPARNGIRLHDGADLEAALVAMRGGHVPPVSIATPLGDQRVAASASAVANTPTARDASVRASLSDGNPLHISFQVNCAD